MSDNGKGVLVITGASTGIGEACALRMDHLGYRVFAGVRKEADGARLKEKASALLTPIHLDVTMPEDVAAAGDVVANAVSGDGIAGLVNNAGIAVGAPLEIVPMDLFRMQLEVNVFGLLAVTQRFIPLVRQAKGRIVNIGSIAGRSATPIMGPYCASKFAVEAMTDALRLELARWDIKVSVIEPGAIATPIWDKGGAAAVENAKRLPPQAESLYGKAMQAMRGFVEEAKVRAIPVGAVVEAVEHALLSPAPKPRYLVGRDAKTRIWLERLPTRMRDKILLKRLNLGK